MTGLNIITHWLSLFKLVLWLRARVSTHTHTHRITRLTMLTEKEQINKRLQILILESTGAYKITHHLCHQQLTAR